MEQGEAHRQVYARAIDALNRADWRRADQLATALLAELPDHAGVCFVAGVAALHQGRLPGAAELLARAVRLNPDRADYHAQLALARAGMLRLREALEAAEAGAGLGPTDPMTLDSLGRVFAQAGDHGRATAMYRRAVAAAPAQAVLRFNLGMSLLFTGDIAGAECELECCLRCDPRFWKAHLALAQLRPQTLEHNHLERLDQALREASDDGQATMYLQLARAKELEDLGEYATSFQALTRGKAAGGRRRGYDGARDRALFEAIERDYPGAAPTQAGHPSQAPIFVFGLPRTGTTLVERILASHPQVIAGGELQDFGLALKRLSGSRTAQLLDADTLRHARALDWRALGEAYLANVQPRLPAFPRFVDKLPHNFLYAGYIANALPHARLLCIRRDPVDACLSNFRQLFLQESSRFDYSYDLLDTGRYYLLFDRLMAFWRQVLPGRILEVDYEGLILGQEASTRRMLEFCGLPWDEACLRFHQSKAAVATASAAQVREPLHGAAMQRWKRYELQLADLIRLLEQGGVLSGRSHGSAR